MGPLRFQSFYWALSLLTLGCTSTGPRTPDGDAAVSDDARPPFCEGTDATAPTDASAQTYGGSESIPWPIRIACERGYWCWENPTNYGIGFSDVLVESTTSVWLAGIDPGALAHFDGSQWKIERLYASIPLTNFSRGRSRGRWVWGTTGTGDTAQSVLFKRTSTGWERATPPNNEGIVSLSESDSITVAVTTHNHLLVRERDAAEWTNITPPVATSPREQLSAACVSTDGRVFALTNAPAALAPRVWQNTGTSSRDWTSRTVPGGAQPNLVCPREGAALTVTTHGAVGDSPDAIEAVHWLDPCARPYRLSDYWFGSTETSAGDIFVGHNLWTTEGFARTLLPNSGMMFFDVDPTRRLLFGPSYTQTTSHHSPMVFDAFDDTSLLFAVEPAGSVRLRNSAGQWTERNYRQIASASVGAANTLWISASNDVRRLVFSNSGEVLSDEAPLATGWRGSPWITFDANNRGWLWPPNTTTIQRWDGVGPDLINIDLGARPTVLTTDHNGGLWVVDAARHVRRCRNTSCEDTGTILPFAPDRVAAAPDGTLWMHSSEGLAVLDASGTTRIVLPDADQGFYVARDGTAFASNGALVTRVRANGTVVDQLSAPTKINAIYATASGSVWISTQNTGAIASLQR